MTAFNKWAILDQIRWDPHPGQLVIAESQARHRVAACGRRFGKSDLGGHELVPEALYTYTQQRRLHDQGKRREFWIVGPQYSDSEKEFRVVYNELKKLECPFDRPGTYNDPLGGSMHISLWDGAFQIHAKSALYPDTLVGEGLSGVIMAEAAKIKEVVWTKHIRPTLGDFKGWSLHTSTPEGKNWFYENYVRGQDPTKPTWASWRMPAWINPYVYGEPTRRADVKKLLQLIHHSDQAYDFEGTGYASVDEMAAAQVSFYGALCKKYDLAVDSEILDELASMTEASFLQEIGAEFTEFVGRVFKDFDEDVHISDLPYNPRWETYGAVDYGFSNPNVWLTVQVGPWGEVNVIREFYQEGLSPNEFAQEIFDRGLHRGCIAFYPDPAAPGDTKILEEKLKIPGRGGTGGELKDRIDGIRKGLKEWPLHVPRGHPDRRAQLMFDRSCTNCKREFGDYRYPEKKEENSTTRQENPMKKDDHTPEALGRFWKGYFGSAQDEAGPSRVSRGRIKQGTRRAS